MMVSNDTIVGDRICPSRINGLRASKMFKTILTESNMHFPAEQRSYFSGIDASIKSGMNDTQINLPYPIYSRMKIRWMY